MFSLRIVTTDHYQTTPIPGLDVQYSELRGSNVWKVPVVRVYGTTPGGQKTCMHVHGVFPYLYVPYDGTQPWDRYLRLFANSLDKALNVSLNNANAKTQHVYKINLVAGIPMYGYHDKEEQFLKIFLYNPGMVKKAADLLLGGAVMNKAFQPHEAHIPYVLQMFIDYNLYGMNMLNVAAVKFRRERKDEENHDGDSGCKDEVKSSQGSDISCPRTPTSLLDRSQLGTPARKIWDGSNIPEDMYLDEIRQSTCQLECDIVAPDILNRLEVDANVGTNPGLAALWEDEKQRRRNLGESSQIEPPPSQERLDVEISDSDEMFRLKFEQIVQNHQPYMDSQPDEEDNSQESYPDVTPASALDLQLSQDDLSNASQDTVMLDEDSDDDTVKPIISVDSIKKVVSMSQSFVGSQPKADSQDKSLAEILASLADETSPSSSQEVSEQITALEERDSILLDKAEPVDEEVAQQQEKETFEMSQVVWDNDLEEDNEEKPGPSTAGYDLAGFDDSWNVSQFFRTEEKDHQSNDDDDDDGIPQFDGAGDDSKDDKAKRKRLGTRGPVLPASGQNFPGYNPYSQHPSNNQFQGQMFYHHSYPSNHQGRGLSMEGRVTEQSGSNQSTYPQGLHKGYGNLQSPTLAHQSQFNNFRNSSSSPASSLGNIQSPSQDSSQGSQHSPALSSHSNIQSPTGSGSLTEGGKESEKSSSQSHRGTESLQSPRMTPSPENDNFTVHHFSHVNTKVNTTQPWSPQQQGIPHHFHSNASSHQESQWQQNTYGSYDRPQEGYNQNQHYDSSYGQMHSHSQQQMYQMQQVGQTSQGFQQANQWTNQNVVPQRSPNHQHRLRGQLSPSQQMRPQFSGQGFLPRSDILSPGQQTRQRLPSPGQRTSPCQQRMSSPQVSPIFRQPLAAGNHQNLSHSPGHHPGMQSPIHSSVSPRSNPRQSPLSSPSQSQVQTSVVSNQNLRTEPSYSYPSSSNQYPISSVDPSGNPLMQNVNSNQSQGIKMMHSNSHQTAQQAQYVESISQSVQNQFHSSQLKVNVPSNCLPQSKDSQSNQVSSPKSQSIQHHAQSTTLSYSQDVRNPAQTLTSLGEQSHCVSQGLSVTSQYNEQYAQNSLVPNLQQGLVPEVQQTGHQSGQQNDPSSFSTMQSHYQQAQQYENPQYSVQSSFNQQQQPQNIDLHPFPEKSFHQLLMEDLPSSQNSSFRYPMQNVNQPGYSEPGSLEKKQGYGEQTQNGMMQYNMPNFPQLQIHEAMTKPKRGRRPKNLTDGNQRNPNPGTKAAVMGHLQKKKRRSKSSSVALEQTSALPNNGMQNQLGAFYGQNFSNRAPNIRNILNQQGMSNNSQNFLNHNNNVQRLHRMSSAPSVISEPISSVLKANQENKTQNKSGNPLSTRQPSTLERLLLYGDESASDNNTTNITDEISMKSEKPDSVSRQNSTTSSLNDSADLFSDVSQSSTSSRQFTPGNRGSSLEKPGGQKDILITSSEINTSSLTSLESLVGNVKEGANFGYHYESPINNNDVNLFRSPSEDSMHETSNQSRPDGKSPAFKSPSNFSNSKSSNQIGSRSMSHSVKSSHHFPVNRSLSYDGSQSYSDNPDEFQGHQNCSLSQGHQYNSISSIHGSQGHQISNSSQGHQYNSNSISSFHGSQGHQISGPSQGHQYNNMSSTSGSEGHQISSSSQGYKYNHMTSTNGSQGHQISSLSQDFQQNNMSSTIGSQGHHNSSSFSMPLNNSRSEFQSQSFNTNHPPQLMRSQSFTPDQKGCHRKDSQSSPVIKRSPIPPNAAYTFTFHVPTPIFKRLKFKQNRQLSSCDVKIVRMHPMDARRYSLLKIGREKVKVKKLTQSDVDKSGVTLKTSLNELLAETKAICKPNCPKSQSFSADIKAPYNIKTQEVKLNSMAAGSVFDNKKNSDISSAQTYPQRMIVPPAQTLASLSDKDCHIIQKVTLTSIIDNVLHSSIYRDDSTDVNSQIPNSQATTEGSSDSTSPATLKEYMCLEDGMVKGTIGSINPQMTESEKCDNVQKNSNNYMSHNCGVNTNMMSNYSTDFGNRARNVVPQQMPNHLDRLNPPVAHGQPRQVYTDPKYLNTGALEPSKTKENIGNHIPESTAQEVEVVRGGGRQNFYAVPEIKVTEVESSHNCSKPNHIQGNFSANLMFPSPGMDNSAMKKMLASQKLNSSVGRGQVCRKLEKQPRRKNLMLCRKRSMNKMLTSSPSVIDPDLEDGGVILKDVSLIEASEGKLTPINSRTPVAGRSPISSQIGENYKLFDGDLLNLKDDIENKLKEIGQDIGNGSKIFPNIMSEREDSSTETAVTSEFSSRTSSRVDSTESARSLSSDEKELNLGDNGNRKHTKKHKLEDNISKSELTGTGSHEPANEVIKKRIIELLTKDSTNDLSLPKGKSNGDSSSNQTMTTSDSSCSDLADSIDEKIKVTKSVEPILNACGQNGEHLANGGNGNESSVSNTSFVSNSSQNNSPGGLTVKYRKTSWTKLKSPGASDFSSESSQDSLYFKQHLYDPSDNGDINFNKSEGYYRGIRKSLWIEQSLVKTKKKPSLSLNHKMQVAFLNKRHKKRKKPLKKVDKNIKKSNAISGLSLLHEATLANLTDTKVIVSDHDERYDDVLYKLSLYSSPETESLDSSLPLPLSPEELAIDKQGLSRSTSDSQSPALGSESSASPAYSSTSGSTKKSPIYPSTYNRIDPAVDTSYHIDINEGKNGSSDYSIKDKNVENSVVSENKGLSESLKEKLAKQVVVKLKRLSMDEIDAFRREHKKEKEDSNSPPDLGPPNIHKYHNAISSGDESISPPRLSDQEIISISSGAENSPVYPVLSDPDHGVVLNDTDIIHELHNESCLDTSSATSGSQITLSKLLSNEHHSLNGSAEIEKLNNSGKILEGSGSIELDSEPCELNTHALKDMTNENPLNDCTNGKGHEQTSENNTNEHQNGTSEEICEENSGTILSNIEQSQESGKDDTVQQNSDNEELKFQLASSIIKPKIPPPSWKHVADTALSHGLNLANNQAAFCSNPDDLPEKARELGGRILKIESFRVSDLEDFTSGIQFNDISTWREILCAGDQFLGNNELTEKLNKQPELLHAVIGDKPIIITPCRPSPNLKNVSDWMIGRQKYKQLQNEVKKCKNSNDSLEREDSDTKKKENSPKEKSVQSLKLNTKMKSVSFNEPCDKKLSFSLCDKDVTDGDHKAPVLDINMEDKCMEVNVINSNNNDDIDEDDVIGPSPPNVSGPLTQSNSVRSLKKIRLFSTQQSKLDLSPNISHCVFPSQLHSTPVQVSRLTDFIQPACTPIDHRQQDTPRRVPMSKRLSLGSCKQAGNSLTSSQINQFATPDQRGHISQIDGPTPRNSFGFQVSQQNFNDAKALHEIQNITVLSMELLAETRGDHIPDPEVDAVQAVFYSILNDVPPEKGTREVTGVILVDSRSAKNQREQEKLTALKQSGISTPQSTPGSPKPSTSKDDSTSQSTPGSQKPSTSKDTRFSSAKPSSTPLSQSSSSSKGKGKQIGHTTSQPDSSQSPSMATSPDQTILQKSGVDSKMEITYVETEKDLFQSFIDLIRKWDPEIVVGWEIQKVSWGFLLQRAAHIGLNLCSQISRIPDDKKASHFSATKDEYGADHQSEIHIVGRIVINLWRIIRHEVSLNIYTFENVMFHMLHQRVPLYSFKALNSWYNHRTHLYRWRVLDYFTMRVKANLQIIDQVDLIGRTSEFARVFGIEFYHVLSRGSQYRVESMMLRLAKPMNFIPVSPSIHQRARMRAPECIPLTLEPESRFYHDPVVVVDFQSLYPSIMIAYNYCFSTCVGRINLLEKAHEGSIEFGCTNLKIPPSVLKKIKDDITVSPNGVVFVRQHVRKGVISAMVEGILNTRIMVKKSMKDYKKDKTLYRLLDARQLGLKLIANVTYGYTGANFSGRMPCIEVADSIVRKARETLERSIKLVEDTPKWGAKVVYGDTDSMFILLKGRSKEDAFKIGYEICDAVTAMHPSPIKLKFEKVYLPCVLQTKKRYVGFSYETPDQKEPVFDAKGIETVRRDACPAVAKILERSIKVLFTTKDVSQVKQYVQNQCRKLMEGKVSMQDLIFAKEYRGMPGYKPGACVPSLEISKKLLRHDRRAEPCVGERVPYVIVYGSPGLPLIQLVKQPWDVLLDPSLRINATYYITKQILPPLDRMLSLLGVDVLSWYNDMPKVVRVVPQSLMSTENKKGTISQYFSASNCPVCDKSTNQNICNNCMTDPQTVAIILNSRIRKWETVYHRLVEICNSCMGLQDEYQPCMSLDCPIMYRRNVASRDNQKGSQMREVLSKCLDF